ncbi:MAG: endonuclease, partial [Cytophagales bacterium]
MNNSIIDNLDFESFAIDCESLDIQLFDAKKHGIIKVYANENQPALFLKEVEKFDFETSKQIAEIQHICWNFQKVLFLYVYTKTEIRIYNCSSKPFYLGENITELNLKKELKKLEIHTCLETDKEKLNILNIVFSRLAVDTGFIWSSEEAVVIREKINLQKRVDKYLIQSLEKAAKELENEG